MKQEEKDAILALKDFMKSVGATPAEIETEFSKALKADPTMTPEKIKEVSDLLGFKNIEKSKPRPQPIPVSRLAKEKKVKTLAEELRELKFGRTKVEQDLLNGFLNVIDKKNREMATTLKIQQRIEGLIKEVLLLQDIATRNKVITALQDIKQKLSD